MTLTALAVLSALSGFAAFYLTLLARKVFRVLVEREVLPLACRLCMAGWTAALAVDVASLSLGLSAWAAWAPSAGLALYLLRQSEAGALPVAPLPPPPAPSAFTHTAVRDIKAPCATDSACEATTATTTTTARAPARST